MSSSKPSRNEPCPCGSGKKYKACHAAEDRARAAPPPPPHPLAAEFQAAMALLGDPDISKLSRALEHLGTLLTRWGPAPRLRFDDAAFDAHLTQALKALPGTVEQDPAQARRDLLTGAVRALGTHAFLEAFRAAVLQRAAESGHSPKDRQALCVGALLASASDKGHRFRPEDIPVLDVVAEVQLREWYAQHREQASKLEALTRFAEGELSPEALEALRQAREGNMDALLQHVQSDPSLVERITREAKERAARVEAKLREPSTPSLFAPEEELWFTCVLWEPMRAMKGHTPDAGTRRAAIQDLLRAVKGALDAELLESMLERLRRSSRDPSLDEATRAFFTDAAIATEAEPSRMIMAALFTAGQDTQGRSAEELVMLADLRALTLWTPEAFEPYRKLLEDTGLPAAAERLRRCQDWLRRHPVSLLPEEA